MATTGKFDGKLLVVYIDDTKIAHSTSFTLSMTSEAMPSTSKDSSNWSEFIVGARQWSLSGEAFFTQDGSAGIDEFWTEYNGNSGTANVRFTSDVSGDDYFHGAGILTAWDITGNLGETSSMSFTFQGTSTLTKSTLT